MLRTEHSALHFISLADLFNRISFGHLQNLFVYKYPPRSITRYQFTQLSELEQRRMSQFARGFTQQHKIRTRQLLIKSPAFYPLRHCATAPLPYFIILPARKYDTKIVLVKYGAMKLANSRRKFQIPKILNML